MVRLSLLWEAPEVNPINHKARSIPVLNVVNMYGRVFFFCKSHRHLVELPFPCSRPAPAHFFQTGRLTVLRRFPCSPLHLSGYKLTPEAWWGFFIAFWGWYAFPPLTTVTIRNELGMTQADVGNANIAALTGTLVVRFLAGPACDRWGPRWTYIGILAMGAIPTALSGLVRNVSGLIALRFFVGILGGTFVPCQVWSTGFFDKNVVGSSNALIGGWGNAGGGITYFLMPMIYDSLKEDMGLTSSQAWRVAFIVPFILITATFLGMIFLCDDTPTGKWSERHNATMHLLAAHGVQTSVLESGSRPVNASGISSGTATPRDDEKKANGEAATKADVERGSVHGSIARSVTKEAKMSEDEMIATARGEIVITPTFKEACHVFFSVQTAFHACTYISSFGGELAINSFLASYYLRNFPELGQTRAGQWASMFGLLNVFTRPLGGIISDLLYSKTHSLWVKKGWILFVGIVSGAFNIAIGVVDPSDQATMFGLVAGMAFFLEAGNGANFGLVPHVFPHANGIISGFTGAAGNLGGVIFAILFRFHGSDYQESFWILGIMVVGFNLVFAWARPIPKNQIGGQ